MRSIIGLSMLVVMSTTVVAADKPEDLAKTAALDLLKAIKAKDAEAVLKLMDTPFLYHEGSLATHKDKADLKTWVTNRLADLKDPDKVPSTIDEVVTFATIKEKIKDDAERTLAEEAVGKDGFVAMTSTGDGKKVVIPVRMRDGKARIVGIIVH